MRTPDLHSGNLDSNSSHPTASLYLVMREKIYALVAQGVLTKEQADIVWNTIFQYNQDDETMNISLSECV